MDDLQNKNQDLMKQVEICQVLPWIFFPAYYMFITEAVGVLGS